MRSRVGLFKWVHACVCVIYENLKKHIHLNMHSKCVEHVYAAHIQKIAVMESQLNILTFLCFPLHKYTGLKFMYFHLEISENQYYIGRTFGYFSVMSHISI